MTNDPSLATTEPKSAHRKPWPALRPIEET